MLNYRSYWIKKSWFNIIDAIWATSRLISHTRNMVCFGSVSGWNKALVFGLPWVGNDYDYSNAMKSDYDFNILDGAWSSFRSI